MPERRENARVSPRILGGSLIACLVMVGLLWFSPQALSKPQASTSTKQELAPMPAHTRLYDPKHPAKRLLVQSGAGSAVAYVPSGPPVKLKSKNLVVVGQTSDGYVIVHPANEKAMAPPHYPVGGGGGQALPPGLPPGMLFLKATNGLYQPIVKAKPTTAGGD